MKCWQKISGGNSACNAINDKKIAKRGWIYIFLYACTVSHCVCVCVLQALRENWPAFAECCGNCKNLQPHFKCLRSCNRRHCQIAANLPQRSLIATFWARTHRLLAACWHADNQIQLQNLQVRIYIYIYTRYMTIPHMCLQYMYVCQWLVTGISSANSLATCSSGIYIIFRTFYVLVTSLALLLLLLAVCYFRLIAASTAVAAALVQVAAWMIDGKFILKYVRKRFSSSITCEWTGELVIAWRWQRRQRQKGGNHYWNAFEYRLIERQTAGMHVQPSVHCQLQVKRNHIRS